MGVCNHADRTRMKSLMEDLHREVPVRLILKPKRGPNGLFIQPKDTSAEREVIENHNRLRFANHFNLADPWTGNTRTYDEQGNYECGRCNQADEEYCLLIDIEKIDRKAGSCRHWENTCAGDTEMLLQRENPKAASYGVAVNGVGFGCKRCPYAEKAYSPDSRGRDLYCGEGDFRTTANTCCSLNGAKTRGQ